MVGEHLVPRRDGLATIAELVLGQSGQLHPQGQRLVAASLVARNLAK